MGLLTLERIKQLHADAIEAGLSGGQVRSTLFAAFDPGFRATFEEIAQPADQLWRDLHDLNNRTVPIEGLLPLGIWLLSAAALRPSLPKIKAFAVLAETIAEAGRDSARTGEVAASQAIEIVNAAAAASPRLGAALADMRKDLNDLANSLRLLAERKNVHDILHRIEVERLPLMQSSLHLVAAGLPGAALRGLYGLEIPLADLRSVAENVPPGSHDRTEADRLLSELAKIDGSVRAAADARNPLDVRAAVVGLRNLLMLEMSRLAARLSTDEMTKVEDVASDLRTAARNFPDTGPVALRLREAATKLLSLGDELRPLLREHRDWQLVDSNMWMAEEAIMFGDDSPSALGRFAIVWPRIVADVEAIAGAPPKPWYARTGGHAVAFASACPIPIAPPVSMGARDELDRFIMSARLQFYDTNRRLTDGCQRLVDFASPLASWADGQ